MKKLIVGTVIVLSSLASASAATNETTKKQEDRLEYERIDKMDCKIEKKQKLWKKYKKKK